MRIATPARVKARDEPAASPHAAASPITETPLKNTISFVIALVAGASIYGCANPDRKTEGGAMPNPAHTGTTPTCKADAAPDDALVGQTEADAIAQLGGCPWRVGERDGQSLPGTMDYREDRRNLGIRNGKVIWVRRG